MRMISIEVQSEERLFFLPFNPVVSVHRKEEKEMQQPRLFPPSRIDILQFSCKQDRAVVPDFLFHPVVLRLYCSLSSGRDDPLLALIFTATTSAVSSDQGY
jgi:hypothetical protein